MRSSSPRSIADVIELVTDATCVAMMLRAGVFPGLGSAKPHVTRVGHAGSGSGLPSPPQPRLRDR